MWQRRARSRCRRGKRAARSCRIRSIISTGDAVFSVRESSSCTSRSSWNSASAYTARAAAAAASALLIGGAGAARSSSLPAATDAVAVGAVTPVAAAARALRTFASTWRLCAKHGGRGRRRGMGRSADGWRTAMAVGYGRALESEGRRLGNANGKDRSGGRREGDGEWEREGPGGACSIAHSSSARSSCRLASSSYAPINSACFFTWRNGRSRESPHNRDCDRESPNRLSRFGLACRRHVWAAHSIKRGMPQQCHGACSSFQRRSSASCSRLSLASSARCTASAFTSFASAACAACARSTSSG